MLVCFRSYPTFRLIRASAKEKRLHLSGQIGLVFWIDKAQVFLVNQHRLVGKPLLPGLFRNMLENPLSEISSPRRKIKTLSLSFKNDAVNCSTQNG